MPLRISDPAADQCKDIIQGGNMDLRVEKTEKAIKNAFIELRSQKPLEKITVKELCAEARINKSTFYSHYQDIYALSEAMEKLGVTNRKELKRHMLR